MAMKAIEAEILSDEKTREQYDSIHTMDPFIKSNYEYAKRLIEEDEFDKAIKVLEALKLDVDNVSFYLGLSEAYMRDEDVYASRNILKEAVVRLKDEDEDNTTIYYQLIVSDITLNQLVDMEEHLETLTTMALKNGDIKDNIAWTLAQLAKQLISLERMDEAKSVIKRASELEPEDEDILEIQTEIDNMDSIVQSFAILSEDKAIDENIVNLIEIHIYNSIDSSMGAFQNESVVYSIKLGLLKDFKFYKKDIRILKQKYPELYNLEKEYFDVALMSMFDKECLFDDEDDDFYDVVEEPYVREEVKVGRN